jgi:uncharacterized protein YejL (UPF0352 family)
MIEVLVVILLLISIGIIYVLSVNNEYFCIACSTTNDLKVFNTTLNETINKNILSNTTICQNTISSNQLIDISCDSKPITITDSKGAQTVYDPIVQFGNLRAQCKKDVLAYNTANKTNTNPDDACKDLFPCYYQDITQDSTISFISNCQITDQTVNSIKTNLQSDVEKKYTSNTDGFATALDNLVTGVVNSSVAGSTKNKTTITNDIKNRMVNIVDKTFVNQLISQYTTNQTIKLAGGSARGITQKSMLSIQQTLLNDNKTYNDLMTQLENKNIETTSVTTRGLSDIVSSITGLLGSWIYVVFGIFACALIAFLIFWGMSSSSEREQLIKAGSDVIA